MESTARRRRRTAVRRVAPYLVIRVEYRDVHFMNLSTGQTFDIDVEMLDDRIQDTNDLRYEAPPCSG